MIDFKKIDFGKLFTPFNFVLIGIVVVTLYAGFLAYRNWSTINNITEVAQGHAVKVTEDDTPASLQVTLFYDYQCPFCYQIDPIVREAAANDGDVELLFKFLPFFGERSEKMGYMAYAAGQQNKFLELHDYFMAGGNREYDEEEIRIMTDQLGLDHDQFVQDMNSSAAKKKIQSNMDLAMRLNVFSTPTLYMNGEYYIPEGEMPDAEVIQQEFDDARQRL